MLLASRPARAENAAPNAFLKAYWNAGWLHLNEPSERAMPPTPHYVLPSWLGTISGGLKTNRSTTLDCFKRQEFDDPHRWRQIAMRPALDVRGSSPGVAPNLALVLTWQ